MIWFPLNLAYADFEPTLSEYRTTLRQQVGNYLGYGRDSDNWNSKKAADVDESLEIGLAQFYLPPPVDGIIHRWSFLYPVISFTTTADDYDYDLPANFGGIEGTITYAENIGHRELIVVGEGMIREYRQSNVSTGLPTYAAWRPKAAASSPFTSAHPQRFELILWPAPDSAYTLTYRYRIQPNALTAADPWPLGGSIHADTIMASCLAAAEEHFRDRDRGSKWNRYMERLRASILFDRAATGGHYLGYNGDSSGEGFSESFAYRRAVSEAVVTYNGAAP